MVCEFELTRPVRLIEPHCPAKVFQSGSLSVPVELLPYLRRTIPPAFQKYRAWLALGKVTVCVKVMVQAACPEPVAVVLLVVPVNVPYSVPEDTALPRAVVTLVISVLTLAKIPIMFPVTGAVLDVRVVLVWVPDVARLLTIVAHCVAVTVPLAATVAMSVCPQPASPDPVLHT